MGWIQYVPCLLQHVCWGPGMRFPGQGACRQMTRMPAWLLLARDQDLPWRQVPVSKQASRQVSRQTSRQAFHVGAESIR
jgi:hypothetical protein